MDKKIRLLQKKLARRRELRRPIARTAENADWLTNPTVDLATAPIPYQEFLFGHDQH